MGVTAHGVSSVFSGMNPLDWMIAFTLAISTVTAFMRGFVRSLLALAGVVAGILLASMYATRAGAYLLHWITPLAVAKLCAFALILALVYVFAMLLGRLLRGAFSAAGLGLADRLAGAAFGFARATLVLAALLVPLAPYLPQFALSRSSLLLPYLLPAAHGISFVMPRDAGVRAPASRWRTHAGLPAASTWSEERSMTVKDMR